MPVQVMPHMYRMLADEIQWALDEVRLWKRIRDSLLIHSVRPE